MFLYSNNNNNSEVYKCPKLVLKGKIIYLTSVTQLVVHAELEEDLDSNSTEHILGEGQITLIVTKHSNGD